MKLLFFISTLSGGGAERVMSSVSNSFSNNPENDVTIVTDTSQPIVYQFSDKVRLLDLERGKGDIKGFLSHPRHFLRTLISIYRYYRKIKPDVVISFQTGMNGMVNMALFFTKARIISSEHSYYNWKYTRFEEFLRKYFYRRANALTVLTRHDLKLCCEKGMHNVVYMPNPVHIEPTDDFSRQKIVLAAGRLDAWEVKGFDMLMQIWGKICKDKSDWTLQIAGTGSDDSLKYLESIAEKYNCVNVEFLGFRKDIHQILKRASVFVLTSRHEGSPMVLLEAMSSGCCCVAFDCETGPNEIITNNKNGLLVDAENVPQFVEKLKKVLEDDHLLMELASKAPSALKKYSELRVMRRWNILINKVRRRK